MVKNLISRVEFARRAEVSAAAVTKACAAALKPATVGKRIDASHPSAVNYLAKRQVVAENKAKPAPASGLDPEYEAVVSWCVAENRYSVAGVRKQFAMGYNRAFKIVATMRATGLVEGSPPPAPGKNAPHARGHTVRRSNRKNAPAIPMDEPEATFEVPENIQDFLEFSLGELIERFGTDIRFLDWLKATKEIEAINEKRLKNATTKGTLISRQLVQVGVIDVFNSAHLKLLKDGAKTIAAGAVAKHASGGDLVEVEVFVSDILGSFIRPVKDRIKRSLPDA